jgi:deoxyribodipyrimidine photo-lyase
MILYIFRRDLRIHDNIGLQLAIESAAQRNEVLIPVFIFNARQIDKGKNPYYSQRAVNFMIESLLDLREDLSLHLGLDLLFFHADDDDEVDQASLRKLLRNVRDEVLLIRRRRRIRSRNNSLKSETIDEIHFNGDLTPYARARDEAYMKLTRDESHSTILGRPLRVFINYDDYFLINPTTMVKPYLKFTPFYNKYIDSPPILLLLGKEDDYKKQQQRKSVLQKTKKVRSPTNKTTTITSTTTLQIDPMVFFVFFSTNNNDENSEKHDGRHGGRRHAMSIIHDLESGKFENYAETRDQFALDSSSSSSSSRGRGGTTRLSAYLKFGCVSIREVFRAVAAASSSGEGRRHALIRQLFWRAFYDQVVYHFPGVLKGQQQEEIEQENVVQEASRRMRNLDLKEKYAKIQWLNDKSSPLFRAWSTGTTGFPLVDAGMRELLATGYMHNRLRMITASFLTKVLHVDWRHGEQFFAQHLVDYHPSANSGGWQWASGSGADSQPYIRIFSPWVQARKFDQDCAYIKRWIPELRGVESNKILSWSTAWSSSTTSCGDDGNTRCCYPAPIVDFATQVKKTLEMYRVL